MTGTYHDNSQDQYGIGEGDHLDRFMRRVEEQGETAESRGGSVGGDQCLLGLYSRLMGVEGLT